MKQKRQEAGRRWDNENESKSKGSGGSYRSLGVKSDSIGADDRANDYVNDAKSTIDGGAHAEDVVRAAGNGARAAKEGSREGARMGDEEWMKDIEMPEISARADPIPEEQQQPT